MAAEVRPLPKLRNAPGPGARTPDQRYWGRFKSQLQIPSHHSAPITSITVPQILPQDFNYLPSQSSDLFAVTSGSILQLYSSRTRKVGKTITRFDAGDNAHSAHIRRDGRVVVAGSDSGTIQVFDANSRAVLKTWKECKQPVWTTRWRHNGPLTDLMSCGDDGGVRLWDLTEEASIRQFWGHQDYVRCGDWVGETVGAGNGTSMLVSGSYDRTIKLWDARVRDGEARGCVMTFKMRNPVEAVLPMPGGVTILASADNTVAVLDLVAAKPLETLRNHQKTVTSLALADHGSRVLTGALDGHVKVYETSSWTVVAGFKYQSPVLSLGVVAEGPSQEDKHLAVGMQSGLLSIRTRLSGEQKVQAREKQKEMDALVAGQIEEYDRRKKKKDKRRGKDWERRVRGKDFTGEAADIVIEGNARGKLRNKTKWETALRRGQYEKALDLVLESQDPQDKLTLITAMRHRSALRTALKGRDEQTLQPILRWLCKAINDPRNIRCTTDVALLILDLYGEHWGKSDEIDRLVEQLEYKVRQNSEWSQMAHNTLGMIEMLQAGAQ